MSDDTIFNRLMTELDVTYNQGVDEKNSKEEYLKKKKEVFKNLLVKNPNIMKTLYLSLLKNNIIEEESFELIERLSKYKEVAQKFCWLDNFEKDRFRHIMKIIENTKYGEKININLYFERILSKGVYVSNLPLNVQLTEEQWKVYTQIVLKQTSDYYVEIKFGEIKEIDPSLNISAEINEVSDLDTYNVRRFQNCDKIYKEAIQEKDLEKAQNAYFNKYFNINIQEAKEVVRLYGSSIEQFINNKEYEFGANYVRKIQRVLAITDISKLDNYYNGNEEPLSFDDSIYVDQFIKQMFSKNMSDSVFKIFDENGVEKKSPITYANYEMEVDGKKVLKKVPIYVPDDNFKMLIHSTAAYGQLELINNNYFDSWNKSPRVAIHGICCSLIANDNMGMAAVNDVLLGFDDWSDQAISKSAPYDIYTNNDLYNIQEGRPLKFMTAQDIIDNTRHTHNEQTLERLELRKNYQRKDIIRPVRYDFCLNLRYMLSL